MTAPVPRVRREEVRRRLLEAAAEVFARRGYEAARLDEIAHAAGFTKGAVYSNFAGKPALLGELIEQQAMRQLSMGAVEVRTQNRPESVADDLAEVFAREIVEQGTWSRLHVEIAQRAAHEPGTRETYVGVRRILHDQLAKALAAGRAQFGVDLAVSAEQLALTLQALRLGLVLEHGTDPEQADRATVKAVVASTLNGVLRRHSTPSTFDQRKDSA